jgi:uncharacterized peroxidase-related enzyme
VPRGPRSKEICSTTYSQHDDKETSMTRLPLIDPNAPGQAKATLDAVNAQLKMVPNLFRVAANSPAALNALVGMEGALGKGALRARVREQLAIAVAQENGCDYCLSAHTAIGKMIGVSESQLAEARAGKSDDAKVDAMLTLAVEILRKRGRVSITELAAARSAGISDAEIVEIVAGVALNIFTNYLNIVADTEIDFPVLHTAELATA